MTVYTLFLPKEFRIFLKDEELRKLQKNSNAFLTKLSSKISKTPIGLRYVDFHEGNLVFFDIGALNFYKNYLKKQVKTKKIIISKIIISDIENVIGRKDSFLF